MTFEERSADRFLKLSVSDFLQELSSPDPIPGAGPATAHVGAVAAALVVMVAGNNLRGPLEDALEERFGQILDEGALLGRELSDLVGEDADVYGQVMAALEMPRENQREARDRRRALDLALKMATDVPLQIMGRALVTYRLAGELALEGSKMAAPDALAAAEMSVSVIRSCGSMVRGNLPRLKDEQYASRASAEVGRMEAEIDLASLRSAVETRIAPRGDT